MSIVTFSRETGSLGDSTARHLAKKLNYVFLDNQMMDKTIDDSSFPDIPLDRFDEHTPSFWENFTTGKDVYLDRLRTAMLECALADKAVILGRGGQFLLKGLPGVFRVRLIASEEVRMARLAEVLQSDRKTAERYCRRSDHDRNGFCRFFFGGRWSNPSSYDLTLNTDQLDSLVAAEIIEKAYLGSPATESAACGKLRNRLRAQRVRNQILYVERIPVDLLEVEAADGHVTVRGTVTVRGNASRCEGAAKNVEGVESVDSEVYFINPVMTS